MSQRPATVTPAVRRAAAPAAARGTAARGTALLATALLTGAVALAAGAAPAAAADGDVQVRRTSLAGDADVRLAVLPGRSDVSDGGAVKSVEPVRVTQAGRRLRADTQPLVAPGHPLAVVVQVRPAELSAAQGLVADALATLPEDVRVSLAPVSTSASSGPVSPSEALAGLDRLVARPSAPATVAGGGAGAAALVVTTCPQGRLPDAGAAAEWVLGWGAGCGSQTPGTSTGLVAQRASTLADARSVLPGLMAQVLAARSVRVRPAGSEPLAVTASGTRSTVLLTGGPAAEGASAAPAKRRDDAPLALLGAAVLGGSGVVGVAALLLPRRQRLRRGAHRA